MWARSGWRVLAGARRELSGSGLLPAVAQGARRAPKRRVRGRGGKPALHRPVPAAAAIAANSLQKWTRRVMKSEGSSDVQHIMQEMKKDGCEPDIRIWNIMLKKCASSEEARGIMTDMSAAGIKPDLYSWNALMKHYSSSEELREVMREMIEIGHEPNVVTWNILLKSLSFSSEVRNAMNEMTHAGVTPDSHSWSTLLMKQSHVEDIRHTFAEMHAAGIQPGVEAWTILMGAYVGQNKNSSEKDAYLSSPKLFSSQSNLMQPTQSQVPVRLKKFLLDMKEDSVDPDLVSWNLLSCASAGAGCSPDDVRRLMEEMKDAGITPDVYSWSALIMAYKHPSHIRHVMEEMREAGVQPNITTWCLLLKSYRKPDAARKVFDEMLAAGVSPDAFFFSTLFNIYLRHNETEEVISTFNAYLKDNPAAINNYIVTAVIRALAISGSEADIISFWDMYKTKSTERDMQMLQNLAEKPYNSDYQGWKVVQSVLCRNS